MAINNTMSSTTKVSPAELLFGMKQLNPYDDLYDLMDLQNESEIDHDVIRSQAENNIQQSQEYNKRYFDLKRKAPTLYHEGDYVMLRNFDVTAGVNKKLINKYRGPYVVKKVLDHDRYLVSDIEGFQVTQRPYEGICNPEHMRFWLK